MKSISRSIIFSVMTATVLVAFQNCGSGGFGSRRPSSQPQTEQNGGTATDNPKPTVDVSIMPHSVSAIQQATICVEDVKFRRASVIRGGSYAEQKALQQAGKDLAKQLKGRDLMIVSGGVYIDAFELPHGSYNVVELVLDDDCASDKSLTVQTAGGAYSTRDRLVLSFDGNGSSAHVLQLDMQPVLQALSRVRANGDIRRMLDSVRGTFQ